MNGGGFVAETDKALGVLRRSGRACGCAFQAKGRPRPLWLRVRWARHGLASALMACGVVVAGGAAGAQPGPPQERPFQREHVRRSQDWRPQPAHDGQEQRVPPRRLTPDERRALMHDLRDAERDIYRQRRGRE